MGAHVGTMGAIGVRRLSDAGFVGVGVGGESPVGGRMEEANRGGQGEIQEAQEEARKIRRLQVMISMVMSVISQDPNMTIEEASELSANARRAALAMFPGKELAFDILYKPRLQRLMKERFRIQ